MLRAEGLRHAFGSVRALDGISFSLTAGRTLAVFGPNGAGKTTLLKVLGGLLRPQAGVARVEGGRRAIGWIGHQSHLYGHLTVRENLLFWASLYGVPAAGRAARADAVLDRLGLADRAHQAVQALSRGLVQRAAIARALAAEPEVLVLDEPVSALDPSVREKVLQLLLRLQRERELTMIFVSHDLDVVGAVADEVLVMQDGVIVEQGAVTDVFAAPQHPFTRELLEANRPVSP